MSKSRLLTSLECVVKAQKGISDVSTGAALCREHGEDIRDSGCFTTHHLTAAVTIASTTPHIVT